MWKQDHIIGSRIEQHSNIVRPRVKTFYTPCTNISDGKFRPQSDFILYIEDKHVQTWGEYILSWFF
jgi:hypothetical protein